MKTLYEELRDANCQITNHESDLYVEFTDKAMEIIKRHGNQKSLSYSFFTHSVLKNHWIDIPFAFTPWWDQRLKKETV